MKFQDVIPSLLAGKRVRYLGPYTSSMWIGVNDTPHVSVPLHCILNHDWEVEGPKETISDTKDVENLFELRRLAKLGQEFERLTKEVFDREKK